MQNLIMLLTVSDSSLIVNSFQETPLNFLQYLLHFHVNLMDLCAQNKKHIQIQFKKTF